MFSESFQRTCHFGQGTVVKRIFIRKYNYCCGTHRLLFSVETLPRIVVSVTELYDLIQQPTVLLTVSVIILGF